MIYPAVRISPKRTKKLLGISCGLGPGIHIAKRVNVVSTTGVVHRANRYGKDMYQPVCNSNSTPFSSQYIKNWKETTEEVTCKNCLRRKL